MYAVLEATVLRKVSGHKGCMGNLGKGHTDFPKNLGANSKFQATRSKLHTEDPQILGTTIQNFVTMETWHMEFVPP